MDGLGAGLEGDLPDEGAPVGVRSVTVRDAARCSRAASMATKGKTAGRQV